jgi:hypothetical protein
MEVTSPSVFTVLIIPACQNHLNKFIRMDAKISPKGIGILIMDYLNVGANGFAQVGDNDYYSKK